MILFATILILKTLGYKIAWYWYILAVTELVKAKIDFNIGNVNIKKENNTQC